MFIVFNEKGKPTANSLEGNYSKSKRSVAVNTSWNVTFESKSRNPQSLEIQALQDLVTQVDINRVASGETLVLNPNKVGTMAKVYINGNFAGGVCITPNTLNVNGFVKEENSGIKVEVVNICVNRIVEDLNLPEKEHQVYCIINPHCADTPLPASRLIGPVSLETIKH